MGHARIQAALIFDIKLSGVNAPPLIFVTSASMDRDALERARILLEQHQEFDSAEIWRGMKLIGKVSI